MGTGPGFYVQRVPRALISGYGSLVQVDTRQLLPGMRGGSPAGRRGCGAGARAFRLRGDLNPAVPKPGLFSCQPSVAPAGYIQLMDGFIASDVTS